MAEEYTGTFGVSTYVFYSSADFSSAHTLHRAAQRRGLDQDGFEDMLEDAEIDYDYEVGEKW